MLFFLLLFHLCVLEDGHQPWKAEVSLTQVADEREEAAGADFRKRVDFGLWCGSVGLFERMEKVLTGVLDERQETELVASALGLEREGDLLRFEELRRFSTEPPPAGKSRIGSLADRERAAILKDRYREIRLANKSTYFDLWTDLSDDELVPYTKVLNGYYRSLKGRFRAYEPASIDVVLFNNRADYLIDYVRTFGTSGENVLGYYVPGRRVLVFCDDPYEKAAVLNTARHECTHLLVDLSYSGAAVPPWLNEGLACFLAADGVNAEGRYTSGLILTLMEELAGKHAVGIEKLMKVDRKSLKYQYYAWSWALIHYLNQAPHEKQFQEFLGELRTELNQEIKPEDVSDRVRTVFGRVFGDDLSQLEADWWYWFEESFRLERPEQFIDLGFRALEESLMEEKSGRKERSVEIARTAFAALPDGLEPDLEAERRLGELSCRVQRAALSDPGTASCRLLLRSVRDKMRNLPSLPNEAVRSSLIRQALEITREATNLPARKEGAYDLRAGLIQQVSRSSATRKDELQAIVVLVDELLEIAFDSQARALEADPIHRQAANEWLFLSMDYAPGRLGEVFETLRLLVELDPDDRNLAALGLAYAGLGNNAWGRHLVESGLRRSARPGALDPYAQRAGVR
ncbi:MAG: hypothetical protein V2A76_16170 [Planctomycetota bacterium]